MAQVVIIAETGGTSMVGSWHHQLLLSMCTNSTLSIRLVLRGDSGVFRPKGTRYIRTAEALVAAIEATRDLSEVADHIDYKELAAVLAGFSPRIAQGVRSLTAENDICIPADIKNAVRDILRHEGIYPPECNSLIDRRLFYVDVERKLLDYYRIHGHLPSGQITVEGHTIELQSRIVT
jgi:hypothetical protein